MSAYLDASAAVAVLVPESRSEHVALWSSAQPARSIHISAWVETEVASALAQKVRGGFLTGEERVRATRAWDRLRAGRLATTEIVGGDFEVAVRFLDDHQLGLRAGDALHLAIAARLGLPVATLDTIMTTAASALGIETVDL